ncbi:MAG TPA: glycoside hydrolase family 3 N-terminal domain-containing protein, partial [Candidatus Tumulicola sp.]|nr:glycoside hydrolase family 3 N-terminal domain-containing protein [Candidatus Tumulicola sp.]
RSFGSDPQHVAAFGSALAAGLARGGIAACGKHFPGHGATPGDTHALLPSIDDDAATLLGRDVAPFAAVAPECAAIMGTHALLHAFDERPATLSQRIVTGLLRGELGYDGVYVTDCLQMAALAQWGSPADAAVEALAAGADLLTISADVTLAEAIVERIERAVEVGTLPLERLREAYARVLRLRSTGAAPIALDAPAPHPGIGREIGRRAITRVRGDARTDPTTTTAISFEAAVAEGIETAPAPAATLRHEAPALRELRAPLDPSDDTANVLIEALGGGRRRPLLLARRAHLHPGQARAIARIVDAYPDAVVASLLEPWDVAFFGNARHVLAAYGDDAASLGGLADVLFGGSLAEGRLPVELPA